jgi:hypothetical protein
MYRHFEERDGLWVNVETTDAGETVLSIGEKGGPLFERTVTVQQLRMLYRVFTQAAYRDVEEPSD